METNYRGKATNTTTETKEDETMNNVKINLCNGTMTIDRDTFTFDGENWIEDEKEDETMDATTIINMTNTLIDIRKGATRSAWNRGLTAYAHELVDGLDEAISGGYFDPEDLAAPLLVERAMLNGADGWNEYSWGGCSLIYDGDIAARLCTPSELKKTDNGNLQPNIYEQWLDVQARALRQAAQIVKDCLKHVIDLAK